MAGLRRSASAQGRRQPGPARRVDGRGGDLRWLLAGIAVYAGVALTGLAIASVSHDIRSLVTQLDRAQRAEDELLAEQSRLLLERSTLASFENVDQVAEERLSMRFPELVEKVQR